MWTEDVSAGPSGAYYNQKLQDWPIGYEPSWLFLVLSLSHTSNSREGKGGRETEWETGRERVRERGWEGLWVRLTWIQNHWSNKPFETQDRKFWSCNSNRTFTGHSGGKERIFIYLKTSGITLIIERLKPYGCSFFLWLISSVEGCFSLLNPVGDLQKSQ